MSATRRAVLALPLLGAARGARAEGYPERPIRLIIPFAAGSATDLQARLYGERIGADWGQPVIVDDRGGANGFIAAEAVARARPDGYTLLFTSNTTHGSNPAMFRRLPYDPVTDFAPVALLNTSTLLVVVNPALPIRDLPGLVAYARANPGRLSFASGSASSRAAGELFRVMAGVDMVNVGYRANPLAITDVIAGTVGVMFCDVQTALPHVRDGRVRALAVTRRTRIESAPELPTVEEAAGLPGYEMLTWTAVFAPAGTPAEIVTRLNAKFNEVLASPAVVARMREDANLPQAGTSADLGRFVVAEIAKWRRLVADAHIEVE